MPRYMVTINAWEAAVYLQRVAHLRDFETPMEALTRVAEMFETAKGFHDTATAECFDQETGVSQWRLEIK